MTKTGIVRNKHAKFDEKSFHGSIGILHENKTTEDDDTSIELSLREERDQNGTERVNSDNSNDDPIEDSAEVEELS